MEWLTNFFGQLFNPSAATPTPQPQSLDVQGILIKNGLGAMWQDEWRFAETNEDLIRMGGPNPNPLPTRQQYYASRRAPAVASANVTAGATPTAAPVPQAPVANATDNAGPFGYDGESPIPSTALPGDDAGPFGYDGPPTPDVVTRARNTVLGGGVPKVADDNPAAKPTKFSFSPEIEAILAKTAKEHGVDLDLLRMFARIESSGNPKLRNGKSQYMGLFQLSQAEFKKHGGTGDIFDANENAKAAAIKIRAEMADFERKHGRPANALDIYMIHQQGPSGYPAHLKNPDAPAWQNLRPYYSSEEMAKKAVWGNVPSDMRKGLTPESITSGQFLGIWRTKVQKWGGKVQ